MIDHSVEIRGTHGGAYEILVDGVDIARCVTAMSIHIDSFGRLPVVEIVIVPASMLTEIKLPRAALLKVHELQEIARDGA